MSRTELVWWCGECGSAPDAPGTEVGDSQECANCGGVADATLRDDVMGAIGIEEEEDDENEEWDQ